MYNFSSLSPYDFEELIADLLRKEWGVNLESFTAGRDSGIDLRCLTGSDTPVIIQCKHRPSSNFRQLFSQMRREELPKITALAPKRYVLVTSVGLTPLNKDKLLELLNPFVTSTDDIIGRSEVNSLLRAHPEIETNNFKLWLTSAAVMQRVLHNAELCQTEFEVERVRRKLPLFVQSSAFPRAQEILTRSRIVVISGIPGIGKTTLADMLLYSHLEQNFIPVVIQDGLADARKLFNKNAKQIFYFDDFLGQTFLNDRPDLIANNMDAALVAFIEAVRNTKHSRFILTTREHILKNALDYSERLSRSTIIDDKCLLELQDYSFAQRSKILYNHLYFGDLPIAYKQAILKDDFFLTIVKHDNFNPRLIEWLSAYIRIQRVGPENYQDHVQRLLDAPEDIWNHAFEHQISEASRNVLITLSSLGDFTDLVDLEAGWKSLHFHKAGKYNFRTNSRDFRTALNELEGSFLRLNHGYAKFLNPSIRDFIENMFCAGEAVGDLMESAIRFKQLSGLRQLSLARPDSDLAKIISVLNTQFLQALQRVLFVPHMRWVRSKDSNIGNEIDTSIEHRLIWLIQLAKDERSQAVLELARKVFDYLVTSWEDGTRNVDINPTIRVVEALDKSDWAITHGAEDMREILLNAVLTNMYTAFHYKWKKVLDYQRDIASFGEKADSTLQDALQEYCDTGAEDELGPCSEENHLIEMRDGLVELEEEYGLSVESVREAAEELTAEFENPHSDDRGYSSRGVSSENVSGDRADDDEIRNMFHTLI